MEIATAQDYIENQGGMPKVMNDGPLTVIHHDYADGKGMLVRSHKSIDDYGEVVLDTPKGPKRFKVALLRAFHGEPCENTSRSAGGKGYERHGEHADSSG